MISNCFVVSLMLYGALLGTVYGQNPSGSYSWNRLPEQTRQRMQKLWNAGLRMPVLRGLQW